MTFDPEPDLDNANVGSFFTVSFQTGAYFFCGVIMVKVNGEMLDIAGWTVLEYLETCDYNLKRIAVEINGEIVPKSNYDGKVFADGDKVEVVSFVGGG